MRLTLTSIVILIILISSACSFKTVIHPYPYQYSGNPEEAADKVEIIRQNGYFYIEPDSGKKVSLEYSNGSLHVLSGMFRTPAFTKNDTYSNPITKNKYSISAEAKYNADYNADEFVLSLTEVGSDSVLGFVEGLVEDAVVYFNERAFRFSALEYFEPRVRKSKDEGKTIWNHYPFGATWSVEIEDVMVGEVLQGSPVTKRFGTEAHYGESFTFLFFKEMDNSSKAGLINAWMVYLALADIDYYYYECDYNDQYDEDCPGSVVIQ